MRGTVFPVKKVQIINKQKSFQKNTKNGTCKDDKVRASQILDLKKLPWIEFLVSKTVGQKSV